MCDYVNNILRIGDGFDMRIFGKAAVVIVSICIFILFPMHIYADTVSFSEVRVTNIHSIDYTDSMINFGWDKVTDAEKYEIWQLNAQTNSYDLLDETEKTEYKIEALEQGKKFTFLIRPYKYDDGGNKVFGNFSEMFNIGTRPDDVTGLVVDHTSDTEIVLNWNKVSDDAEYVIYRVTEGTEAAVQIGTSAVNSYTDKSVQPACGYTYRVAAYICDTSNKSGNEAEVITAACPTTPYINQCKGGDGRVRFRWSTGSAAGSGYIIYVKDIYGKYQEISRVSDITVSEYIQMNLAQYMPYNFIIVQYKSYNGAEYYSQPSNEVAATTTGASVTSFEPAIYKSNKKLKKSKMFKKYSDFTSRITLNKNVIVPGIKSTNVYGFESNSMVIQAVCFAESYMLVSAYDTKEEEKSVVYVIKRSTGKYITTLVLPDSYHVGGIAYDGNNIWVSTGTAVSCFSYNAVAQAASSGADAVYVSYTARCPVAVQASFISYYNNILWVGEHKETQSSKMYGYQVNNKEIQPVLEQKYVMGIPSRTQDVEFINKKTIIISRSNQVSSASSKYYISRMERYKLDYSQKSSGKIKRKKCTGKLTMPPMLEGIACRKKYLYISFESAQISSCPYKLDRICAIKLSKIKWKK